MFDYEVYFLLTLSMTMFIRILIAAKSLVWLLQFVFVTPFYMLIGLTQASVICVLITIIVYYKIRFDQVNNKFQTVVSRRCKLMKIKRQKENQLIKLINRHNLLSIEIHHLNLCIRRGMAVMFITFSIINVITLYLLIKIQEFNTIKFIMGNIFGCFFFVGFGMSILYSVFFAN